MEHQVERIDPGRLEWLKQVAEELVRDKWQEIYEDDGLSLAEATHELRAEINEDYWTGRFIRWRSESGEGREVYFLPPEEQRFLIRYCTDTMIVRFLRFKAGLKAIYEQAIGEDSSDLKIVP
jgi:hypothetical protein